MDHLIVEWPTGKGAWTAGEARRVADAVGDACRRRGYFFLKNHGVSEELFAAAFAETRRFYSSSLDHKHRFDCSAESEFLGYRGFGSERSRIHPGAEACEQYRIGNVSEAPAVNRMAGYYHEPFRQGSALFEELAKVGRRLVSSCAVALGLEELFFERFMAAPMHRLGLNRFPVGGGRAIGNSVNYAMTPHIDHSVLTMLVQDQPGLEVSSLEGRWVDVPVIPGHLFVFCGDYIERWTNGAYRATPHRVREVSGDRMSLQYKHKPSYGTVVAPLGAFVGDGRPARYEAFDTGCHYTQLLKELLAERGTAGN